MEAKPDADPLARTALLARLSIGGEEAARLARDFERILASFRDLLEADIEGVEGVERAGGDAAEPRADEPAEPLGAEPLLGVAPEREGAFFRVPKTIGGRG